MWYGLVCPVSASASILDPICSLMSHIHPNHCYNQNCKKRIKWDSSWLSGLHISKDSFMCFHHNICQSIPVEICSCHLWLANTLQIRKSMSWSFLSSPWLSWSWLLLHTSHYDCLRQSKSIRVACGLNITFNWPSLRFYTRFVKHTIWRSLFETGAYKLQIIGNPVEGQTWYECIGKWCLIFPV